MTFGSTFGRVLSPTFQPKSQAAAASSWWLAGGIDPANCIVAYQPKGAADYAASKVNLANPGTYNGVGINTDDMPWSANTGWNGDGSHAISTGFTAAKGKHFTAIARITNRTASSSALFGPYLRMRVSGYWLIDVAIYSTGTDLLTTNQSWNNTDMVIALNYTGLYSGGSLLFDFADQDPMSANFRDFCFMGAAGEFSGFVAGLKASMPCCALYDTAISDEQILAVSTAMAAL